MGWIIIGGVIVLIFVIIGAMNEMAEALLYGIFLFIICILFGLGLFWPTGDLSYAEDTIFQKSYSLDNITVNEHSFFVMKDGETYQYCYHYIKNNLDVFQFDSISSPNVSIIEDEKNTPSLEVYTRECISKSFWRYYIGSNKTEYLFRIPPGTLYQNN